MELEQVIIAFGIAFFLGMFLTGFFSLVYPQPKYVASTTSCTQLINDQCGSSDTTTLNASEYSKCRSAVIQTSEYRNCISQNSGTTKLNEYKSKLQTYNLVSLIVFGFLGILFVAVGFSISHFRSISSGLILSGFFILIFSNLLVALSGLSGVLLGAGLSSKADNSMQIILKVIGLFFDLVVLVLLIILGYIHVDKRN